LLQVFDASVLRLIRVAIGSLSLGDLPKGGWRILSTKEIDSL
jgi:23S rRNA pseudouridine2605 synthase